MMLTILSQCLLTDDELSSLYTKIEKWCEDGIIDVGTVLVFDRKGHSTVLPYGKTDLVVYEDGDDYVLVQSITREVSFGSSEIDWEEEDDVWEEKTVRMPKN